MVWKPLFLCLISRYMWNYMFICVFLHQMLDILMLLPRIDPRVYFSSPQTLHTCKYVVDTFTHLVTCPRKEKHHAVYVSKHQSQKELIQEHRKISDDFLPAFLSDRCILSQMLQSPAFQNVVPTRYTSIIIWELVRKLNSWAYQI